MNRSEAKKGSFEVEFGVLSVFIKAIFMYNPCLYTSYHYSNEKTENSERVATCEWILIIRNINNFFISKKHLFISNSSGC